MSHAAPGTTTESITASTRRADIDALRALAVVLVLVVHVAQVFSPWQTWHVQNVERSKWLAELSLLPGPWLMSLFMVLAGRSAYHSLARRGNRTYLIERLTRLALPLVAGVLILVPPQLYVRRVLEGRFSGSFLEFYPHFFEGIYPEGNLSWGHLWFLAYVLLYGSVGLPLLRVMQKWVQRRRMRWTGVTICLMVAPWIVLQALLREPYPQSNALVADWANHAQLFPAFLFGFLLAADDGLEAAVSRVRVKALVIAIITTLGIAVFAWPGNFGERLPQSYSITYATFWTVQGIEAWSGTLALSAWARQWRNAQSALLTYGREAVYPFYLLHQPVLVLLAWPLVRLAWPIAAEFVALLLLAPVVTLLLYDGLRRWRPARVLLGLKPGATGRAGSGRASVRTPPT
jgi:peptidoglycan/LPS O-acetylase OafA/YrhL